MKKLLSFFYLLLLGGMLSAQVVTTEPAFITDGYTGQIRIIYDPSQGTGAMSTATKCYAHTGVSTSDGIDWQCAPAWPGSLAKYAMTKEGTKWVLTIPNMYEFYNCAAVSGKTFTKLSFVFNDGGTKEGKGDGGEDIYVDIVEAGLNVKFDVPDGNKLIESGTSVNIQASASASATLKLLINGTQAATQTGTLLTHSLTFSTAGDYVCVIEATDDTETVKDTVNICVPSPVASQARPSGVKDGINYYSADNKKVTLVMYAKDKNNVMPDNVFLLGDFNDWSFKNEYQLKKDATTGYWWITLEGLTPGQEYAFQYAVKKGTNVIQISDAYTEKVLDPWNDKYISESVYPGLTYPKGGDGLVSVFQTDKPEFAWSDETLNFQRPDKNNLVIYELWVYDFSNERNIKEVTNRLDYLESLGVNAIELMPVTEFDGNISWGYNPNHFFAPDKSYGTSDDYKTFIDECHKRGIAVILDMVFNHSTGIHPFAKLYWGTNGVAANNPWYNTQAPHDDSVNQDYNHDFSGTSDYFKEVLKYWLKEYKIDGYRMDLTKGLCGTDCNNRINIINAYHNAVKSVENDAYFILEHWTSSEEPGFVNNGMLCWNNTNNAYSQTAMGWLKEGDNLSGASKKGWVSYCGSHDEERNFFKADAYGNGNLKGNKENYLPRVPLNLAFNVLLEGPKMIWQFDEMGYDYSITHNGGDRVDPKPLPEWGGWYQDPLRMSAYGKSAQVVSLRTQLQPEVFTNGSISSNVSSGKSIRTITWTNESTKIFVVGNFNVAGGTQYTGSADATMPEGTWYDYFNNGAAQAGNVNITLQPGELRIFTSSSSIVAPNVPNGFDYISGIGDNEVDAVNCIVYPTFTSDLVFIESDEEVKNVQLISLKGGVVKSGGRGTTQLDVSGLNQGLYLMIVSFENSQKAFKIVKQ